MIILSPAKTMNMTGESIGESMTSPLFGKETEILVDIMRQYSAGELEKLLKISQSLAQENYQRYQQFAQPDNPVCPAILAYNGSVFKNINAGSFSKEDFQYAQKHLRIISILYGLLRPLDGIQAYRLAYMLKLRGLECKNLYDYWFPKLTPVLIKDVLNTGGILVNLASLDVLGAFNMTLLEQQVQIITPEFKEERNGTYETIRTYAKLARGAMTRFLLLNRIESQEKMKTFEWEGFHYDADLSDEKRFIFTRKKKNRDVVKP